MTRRHWLLVGIGITLAAWTPRAEEDVAARITGAALTRGVRSPFSRRSPTRSAAA